jgi:multidrug efflux pump subunit AcrB
MLQLVVPAEIARKQDPIQVLKKLRSIEKGEFTSLSFDAQRNGPPVGSALSITFRSNYIDELKGFVTRFKEEVSQIPGVVDLKTDVVRGGPEFRVIPNYERIASMNIKTEEVGMALRTALQGAIVSELTRDGDDFYIRVRYQDHQRASLQSLKDTHIMDPVTRRLVPLYSIVSIKKEEAPEVRKHFDMKRAITVTSNVDPEKITSIVLNQKAQAIVGSLQKDFPRVSVVTGGEAESTKESLSSLMNAMVLSFMGIFGILVFLFRSFLRSMLVLSTIPLGLIGVSIAFYLHGRPFSFIAMIGVVGLAGVIVNAAIVLVSYIDEVLEEGKLSLQEALAKASTHRLRSVLVTGLTTVGGLLPSAYGIGGTDEILVPMTLALAWGLVSGTIVTLIWVPCGYAIIEDYMKLVWKLIHFFQEKFINRSTNLGGKTEIAYRER